MMSFERGAESCCCRCFRGADVKTHESNHARPNCWSPSGKTGSFRRCRPGRKSSPPSKGGGARAERNKRGEIERGQKAYGRALRRNLDGPGETFWGTRPRLSSFDCVSYNQGRESLCHPRDRELLFGNDEPQLSPSRSDCAPLEKW